LTSVANSTPYHALNAPPPWVKLMGARFTAFDEATTVATIVDAALSKRGLWAITANLDHLRRYTHDRVARELMDEADIVLADGTPIIWASRLAGHQLPERVTGSNMILSINEHAAERGASVFLLGGAEGVADRASSVLRSRFPDLRVAATLCPPMGFENSAAELLAIDEAVRAAGADIVLVALGFPKQDLLIRRLRAVAPHGAYMGVGISFSFVTGQVKRAPAWTQKLGLEWVTRLIQEPRRLVRRYLVDGVPFAAKLLLAATLSRLHHQHRDAWDSSGVRPVVGAGP
jgi:N-acetylglucosaminyldiphosphoundecaprenol N-acetyl-beta-D-mannosaminyltransferase